MDKFLTGKCAVVTGGTRGIGYAIAHALAAAGAEILICGRTESSVQDAVGRLRSETGSATVEGLPADVSIWDEVFQLFQIADRKWNKLDVLVNNAGVGIFAPVADLAPDAWHKVIDLNLTGLYYCCHAALPLLRASGDS